jgi:hypothetical protein
MSGNALQGIFMAEEPGASSTGRALPGSAPERSLKIRIAKKAFVFDVRKKFAATRTFAVKKKPETPAEGIKDTLLEMLSSRKRTPSPNAKDGEGQKAANKEEAPAQGKKPPSTVKLVMGISAGLFLLFLLIVGLIVLQYGGAGGAPPPSPSELFMSDYSFNVIQSRILSTGQSDKLSRAAYFLVGLDSSNLSRANFSVSLYSEKPVTQVFMLDYPKESADTYLAFYSKLSSKLGNIGIPLNEIGVESLSSLPEGALLIIPTGYFPSELLGLDGGLDYKDLLRQGVDIVYIGMPFDSTALDHTGSTVRVGNADIIFARNKPDSSDGFLLFDAQYSASPGKDGSSEGMQSQPMLYGSVSSVKLEKGSIMFIPQLLDGGWASDPESAAIDITRLVYEENWLAPMASGSYTLYKPKGTDVLSVFTSQFQRDSAFARISASVNDTNGAKSRRFIVTRVEKAQLGDLTPRDLQTVPFYLSGTKTRLNLVLREPDDTPVKLYVGMYKDGSELQRSEFELGLTNPTIEKSVDFQVNSEPGRYVVMVVDATGKVYAATMLTVIDLDIDLQYANWQKGQFNFTLSSAGKPISPYSLSVTLDGKGEQQYSQSMLSKTSTATKLEYAYSGKISPGNHKFTFFAGAWDKNFYADYFQRKNFWDNPVVLVLGVVSLLVFILGTILRRPEVLRYGLDIPDFPALSTIKIPLKRETVLEIFDNVNAGYSWRWMPLRAEELKSGFRKLTYNGKPILIGDFNLERVLAKLREEGAVKDELDYWGKTEWEKQSRHSIRYLMVYRILRNVFVNNAVKFSKLDAIPECDVKAVVGNEEIYLHIMEEPRERAVHRALATVGKGHTIIVFKTREEAEDFRRALNSPSKLAVALKMEVNSRNIMLLPVKEAVSAYIKGITG